MEAGPGPFEREERRDKRKRERERERERERLRETAGPGFLKNLFFFFSLLLLPSFLLRQKGKKDRPCCFIQACDRRTDLCLELGHVYQYGHGLEEGRRKKP